MKNIFCKSLIAAIAAACALPVFAADYPEKNVLNVDFRSVPADFENLPARETEKWSFNFRPYDAEAAALLWTDPMVIRNVSSGADVDAKHLPTGVYACCDEYGLYIFAYGASVRHGIRFDKMSGECFVIPGDNDSHVIRGYQPFGFTGSAFMYKLMWMKEDRNNREMFNQMVFNQHNCANGTVVEIHIPWAICWDTLPVFKNKKDNFWRLSMIRWGGSAGAESWGGRVHSQSKCGYLRMPDFTPEQESKILKTTLVKVIEMFNDTVGATEINPGRVGNPMNAYRQSIAHLPHSWMNVNEDPEFRPVLQALIQNRRDIIKVAEEKFGQMTLEEQKAFYLENVAKLANFRYDVEDAYAEFLNQKLLAR